MSEAMPATGIAGILAAPGSCARPSRAVPPGSVAELSCQKIIFDLQLADLPVQMIDLGLIAGSLCRTTTLEDACRTVQQLLLPVVDLVRVDPELPSQLGDGPVAPDGRQRHLRLERRAVLLPCPLHVLLPRYPRFLGAGLHLSHLSHFWGPAQTRFPRYGDEDGFCWWGLYWPRRRIQEGRSPKGFNTAMRSFAQRHFLE